MNIIVYRYGSICEPDIINAFKQVGLDIIEERTEITNKSISNSTRVEKVATLIKLYSPIFIFSINFYPAIAEICELYNTLYLCWTVDSPIPELFSSAIQCKTNRIFLFDYAQYEYFNRFNSNNIFYLPLASCVERFDKVITSITDYDRQKYSTDISFIGSLYNEKNPMKKLILSDYSKGYTQALVDSALQIYGYNPVPDAISPFLVEEIKLSDPNFYTIEKSVCNSDSYIVAHSYIGMQIAESERINTFNELAKHFNVDLFTRSDTSDLVGVTVHSGVETLTEMPKIFNLSKINLNITIKPIQTGLPLRIFDILGCGGFLLTNYQSELADYFESGVDIETYSSIDELIDKCDYYLSHDEERIKIAQNGYNIVKSSHLYIHRIKSMLKAIL